MIARDRLKVYGTILCVFFLGIWSVHFVSAVAPNAPTQDLPTNNATSVSITPTFKMTATDPEGDALGYKVTIYSDDTCTTVVQTNNQANTGTGWSGTDGTCTGAPTACYLSGTQGIYLTQTPLSNSTAYWWKASAQDPDESATFTDSATCNAFTTIPAVSISLGTDGSVAFGTLPVGSVTDTTAGALNDVQTVTADTAPTALEIRSGNFSDGAHSWTLGSSNGNDQVKWEFSTDTSSWTTFAVSGTLYSVDTNVASGTSRDIYFRLTMPSDTNTFTSHSATVTIVASTP